VIKRLNSALEVALVVAGRFVDAHLAVDEVVDLEAEEECEVVMDKMDVITQINKYLISI
jgi:hypothetical protein